MSTKNVLSFVKRGEENNWEKDSSDLTAQQSFDLFRCALMKVFKRSFPTKRIEITDNNKRKNFTFEASEDLLQLKNHLSTMGTVARATKHDAVYDSYNAKKEEYHKRMDEEGRQNNIEYIQIGQNYQKSMWNIINNEKKRQEGIPAAISRVMISTHILSTALKKF
ncbi:hypothetical protein HHI36_004736 [Cryptolaemus montrouzieri]|uniref:Uncharacterized protein n=1 Tax=Cryptolaemus montrouzieri TaxID=559131 RepID=A0ABD2NSH1_9CUCU